MRRPVAELQPTFQWNAAAGAASYDVIVHKGVNKLIHLTGISGASVPCPFPLQAGQDYRWKVRGVDGEEVGAWSAFTYFKPQP